VKNLPERARRLNFLYDRRRKLEALLRSVSLATPLVSVREWKRQLETTNVRIDRMERSTR
jgi:hypothetical protein